ncbi:MAG: hypothetical protein GX660_18340 [Clostridiaceae bacterium]|nr:hypothetical protein [Clostridiaceae bacterium]
MANKKFDPNAAFKNIVGAGNENEDKQEQKAQPPKSSKVEPEDGEKFKQRSYYLTDELLKAITIKTAETNLDKSGVVREALEMYLADILEKFRK